MSPNSFSPTFHKTITKLHYFTLERGFLQLSSLDLSWDQGVGRVAEVITAPFRATFHLVKCTPLVTSVTHTMRIIIKV